MIVVDSSAVVAIFRQEADAERHARRIGADASPAMSAANVLETSIVLRSLKQISMAEAERWLDTFLRVAQIRVEPVTADHVGLARTAHARFGKGTGHQASLNFGDCFAYALSKALGAPLLFKGDDFSHTDLESALER